MKAHDLSRRLDELNLTAKVEDLAVLSSLNHLATLLREAPNVDISDLRILRRTDEMAVGVRALLSLSKYSKQQWLQLAQDHGMALELNPRDSTRDVVGKVLRFLESHPETVKMLGTQRPRRTKVDTSALENALTKLLERKDG